MLYIGSALSPTPILDTFSIPNFTPTASSSLVVAKPDRVEVWDVDASGLSWVAELEVWGSIVAISKTSLKESKPHILVLLSPPNAHLLLVTYQPSPKPSLVVTSSIPLTPPTPSLRQAEFFTSVIAHENLALVSLWVGVLSCIEIEVEKEKDAKKRRASTAGQVEIEDESKRLKFRDNFNINIREHNLLHLAFLPQLPAQVEPSVSFLWQSSTNALQLQIRTLSAVAHSFVESSKIVDVVTPLREAEIVTDTDFNDIPYSCPAARRVVPVSADKALVIGDEYAVLYGLSSAPSSPKASRASFSSNNPISTSPRASAIRRSPQTEMLGTGKRRKSSLSGRRSSAEFGDKLDLKPIFRVRQGFGTVLAASVLESHSNGASVILGDECGRLTAVGWEIEKGGSLEGGSLGSVQLTKVKLGTATPPSSITYLDSSHVFLSSACGDSLLLKLQLDQSQTPTQPNAAPTAARAIPVRKGKGRARDNEEGVEWHVTSTEDQGSLDVKERWMNLAPLKDFCVVEEEGGGVSHLVAASGASTSNSLRIIRSGVGLEDLAVTDGIPGITHIIAIKQETASMHAYLVSTATSTYWLEADLEPAPMPICLEIGSLPTITVGMLEDDAHLVHVSPRAITLRLNLSKETPEDRWEAGADNEIVAAAVSNGFIIAARRSGEVTILTAKEQEGPWQLSEVLTSTIQGEVSAVAIYVTNDMPSPAVAIATWSNEIFLYTLDHLQNNASPVTPITEASYAVSLILKPSSSSSTPTGIQLLAGLSDGTMVIYDLEESESGGGLSVESRKASSLGTGPLRLQTVDFPPDDEERVIAVGLSDRMSVIFETKDRIDISLASRKNITAATGGYLVGSDDVLLLATPTGFTTTKVNSLKKLSVQTLDTGERSATKLLSYNTHHKLLGVGSVSRKMDSATGDVLQSGCFELRDANTLAVLPGGELKLNEREEVTCLSQIFLLGYNYFAVGTAIFPPDEESDEFSHGGNALTAKEGRVLLIQPRLDPGAGWWHLEIRGMIKMVGPIHDVKMIHGLMAIAAGSKVSVHKWEFPFMQREVSRFSSQFIASHIHVIPPSKEFGEERFIVGDGLRSITELEIDEGSGMLHSDNRDMATHQVMAMDGIRDGKDGIIISDGYANLMTFRFNEDEGIQAAATFGLHEDIARFRKGSLVPANSAPETMTPELLYATSDGRLGVIGELTPAAAKTLSDLQRNMDKYYTGPGGINWKTWRRGGTEVLKKETGGFIDGDFVQKFLNSDLLPSSESEKILSGTNSHERVSKIEDDDDETVVEATRGDVVRVLEAVGGLH